MSAIEEKDGRSLAAANSLIQTENQNHPYNQDETPDTAQGAEDQGLGESAERSQKSVSKVTGGRHVVSAADGAAVRKEREAHVLANRKATEKLFERRKRKA
jgi:hypothetical protein